MSADFQVHILEGIDESVLEVFFAETMGSKYCPMTESLNTPEGMTDDEWIDSAEFNIKFTAALRAPSPPKAESAAANAKVLDTPGIWIGEASIFGNPDECIPPVIDVISALVDENLPIIDDVFISEVAKAFDIENTTTYNIAEKEPVLEFFRLHKGKQVFSLFL